MGSLIYGWLVRDKWINVTVRGTGCVWSYFIFIYPIGFSEEIFVYSFIVITERGGDQPRLSQWHWSDLGAILAQDLISDLFWELSRPPLAPWWFIIYHCEGWRCLLRSFLFHCLAVPCSENVDLISSEHSSFLLLFFTQGDHLGQDRDHSAMKFYLFVLTELIHSAFALVMGQTEIILWWGFIYRCWRSWSTPCLHLWCCYFYPFGVDPPALIWWADPPIFILNHPRLQRMKSLLSSRVQCMCSHARRWTVIGSLIFGW